MKVLQSQLNKFYRHFCRKKDDCWNTGCLNRNCFDEVGHTKNEFSWAEPMVFGEKDLIEDLLKGNNMNIKIKLDTLLYIFSFVMLKSVIIH